MWHRKCRAHIIAVIAMLLLSAFAVNSLMAQDVNPPASTPTPVSPTNVPTNTPMPTPTTIPTNIPTSTALPTATNLPTQMATTVPTATATSTILPTVATVPPAALQVQAATATAQAPAATVTTGTASNPSSTIAPQIVVMQIEPSQITLGKSENLSIIGANFTENTSVRLLGYGFLKATFINSGSLTAELPSSVPTGSYAVEVRDSVHGTALAPNAILVLAAPTTATPTPELTPTPSPTEIPGQPKLVVRSFYASPASVYPGGTTQITFEVVNVGARTAQGVVVALGDSKFAPANGQASVTLPDLAASASWGVVLSVVAPADASEGPATIPLVLSSHDSTGTAYKDSANVSVNILAKQSTAAQVVLKSYTVTPKSAFPGETVMVQAVINNSGNTTASQVLIQLNEASAVLIAGSKGNSVSVGELKAKASKTITLPLIVANDAKAGVQAQAFTISYLQGTESKQATASISLEVKAKPSQAPQVVLKSYSVTPKSAAPGETVTVQAELANTGNVAASQVLVQLSASTSDTNTVLIAGTQGGSITVGDLQPQTSKTITLPLVVANDAKAGVQSQTFTISYLQDSESKQTTASISLEVDTIVEDSPVLLLKSYSTGQEDALQPGQQFTYEMTMQNAGKRDVSNLLITFGTLKTDSSSSTSSTASTSSTTTTAASTTSSTTASTNFMPIGSGDTVLVGNLTAGQAATLKQTFIVNSGLDSGIYTLPVTLQYKLSDGTTTQQSMNASLVVVVPAKLRASITSTLPDKLTAGETYSLSVKIANLGSSQVAVTNMHVTGENVTITKGGDALLDPLASEDYTTESVTIQAKSAGEYKVTVEIAYTDALNSKQTYTTAFTGEVAAPTVQQTLSAPPVQASTQNQNLLGRLLLGFLGLGG